MDDRRQSAHVCEVPLGIQVVKLSSTQEALHRGGALATRIRAEEEIFLRPTLIALIAHSATLLSFWY